MKSVKRICELDAENREVILFDIHYIRKYLIPKYRKLGDIDTLETWKTILNGYLQRKQSGQSHYKQALGSERSHWETVGGSNKEINHQGGEAWQHSGKWRKLEIGVQIQ